MRDSLERLLNWQSDQDWVWGPFVSLRPSPTAPIRPWVWVRLFLIFTALGLGLVGSVTLGVALLGRLNAPLRPLPPPLPETLATLGAMAHDPATRALLIGLTLALPPLFFLFCLPYHWAWNRRAARLSAGTAGGTRERPGEAVGVWPPAPRA